MHGCRAFAYMVEDGYIPETTGQTYNPGVEDFCELSTCEACKRAKNILSVVVDKENIWRAGPEDLSNAKMVELVFGDIELLGWAVIKG